LFGSLEESSVKEEKNLTLDMFIDLTPFQLS